MLHIYGVRNTLLAYLVVEWAEQHLQIPQRLRSHLLPPIRLPRPEP
jgi:hypothetical protein